MVAVLATSALTMAGSPAQAATLPPCTNAVTVNGLYMPGRGTSVDCYLVYGMWNNSAVEALQTALRICYDAPVEMDGDFGRQTQSYLKIIQSGLGITADGQYGRQTRAALHFAQTKNISIYACKKSTV
jgi:peptidoglycan hydrolase-like protein with peptidoglycan-binding domain